MTSHTPKFNSQLGWPRLHFSRTDSTNEQAKQLAIQGAPNGTLVTANEQTAGRGRQGRSWYAPAGQALLASLILREPPDLLTLRAGVAIAQAIGTNAKIKWPNDVLINGRKVAGILCEGRPDQDWAVVGIGINIAIDLEQVPKDLRPKLTSLNWAPHASENLLPKLLKKLTITLNTDKENVLSEFAKRDALAGQTVRWSGGEGTAQGVDPSGNLLVQTSGKNLISLNAGEVHLKITP